jgi:hypothetical protein
MSNPEGPRPDESQTEYERRVGLAPAAEPTLEQLRQELADAEAREKSAGAQQQASALGATPGAPAGAAAAAAVASGTAGQAALPAELANVPVGALGTGEQKAAPAMEITHSEPVLAQGATGEAVQRLVKLLAYAGYASNSVVNAAESNPAGALDTSVMSDVERLWNDHPEARESDELYYGREGDVRELRGSWVGPHTWQVLYNLASARGQ